MEPANYPITIQKGATFNLPLELTDDDGPIDLAGATITSQLAVGAKIIDCNVANSRIVMGPAANQVEMVLSAEDTASLSGTGKSWKLLIRFADDVVWQIFSGAVIFEQ